MYSIKSVLFLFCFTTVDIFDFAYAHGHHHHHNRSVSVTQNNDCEEQVADAQRLVEIRKLQVERNACKCSTIQMPYAPVCGSDGVTYYNRCYLSCTAVQKYHRFHQKITLEKHGPCDASEVGYEIRSGPPRRKDFDFGENFWRKECPYINKLDTCTEKVKTFCAGEHPSSISL